MSSSILLKSIYATFLIYDQRYVADRTFLVCYSTIMSRGSRSIKLEVSKFSTAYMYLNLCRSLVWFCFVNEFLLDLIFLGDTTLENLNVFDNSQGKKCEKHLTVIINPNRFVCLYECRLTDWLTCKSCALKHKCTHTGTHASTYVLICLSFVMCFSLNLTTLFL